MRHAIARAERPGVSWLILTVWLALSAEARAADPSADCPARHDRHWQGIAAGVWAWPGAAEDINPANRGHVTTQILIAAGRNATLIDPGPSLEHGREVIRSAHCELGLTIDRVLDSHAHAENVLGNAAFVSEPGLGTVIESTAAIRSAMAKRCEQCSAGIARSVENPALAAISIVLPETGLQAGQHWHSDSGSWLTLEFVSAHSENDLAWWNEHQRLLIAPGLLYQDRLPELAQGSLQGWISALRELRHLRADKLIGNQPMAPAGLDATADYLCELGLAVMQALQSGLSATEATRIELPRYSSLAGYSKRHAFNVQRAWRELEPLWIQGLALDCPRPG